MKKVSLTPAVFQVSNKVNAVCSVYAQQPVVPRGPALKPILDRLRFKIVDQLGVSATHETIILTASGSGGIAAAVGSCVDDQGILVIANDAYGERQAQFCRQLGIRTAEYRLEWGKKPDMKKIKDLVSEHQLKTIGMVHGCTGVGLLNPVAQAGVLCREMGLRLIVDAIASIYVEELETLDWHIDTLICSTNKGLHSNPDLCFCVVKKDYLEEMSSRSGRIPYLDLYATWSAQTNGSHPFTINMRALKEFEAAIDDFNDRGGLRARIKMYQDRTGLLREGYKRMGLKTFLSADMEQQNIGTALYLPPNVSYEKLADDLANWKENDECYEIYSAQGKLFGQVFRVFNMGEYFLNTYERFLVALESCLMNQT